MKGSSNATRRHRVSSSTPQRLPFSGVPIGSDDDDNHYKKKRITRQLYLLPLILAQQFITSVKPVLVKKAHLLPAIFICMLLLSVLSLKLGFHAIISTLPIGSLHAGQRRRLHQSTVALQQHLQVYGKSHVLLPQRLDQLALDGLSGSRHYGGIDVDIFEASACPKEGCRRQIYHDFRYDEMQKDREDPDEGTYDNYYAFDDDRIRSPYVRYSTRQEDLEKRCRRVSWYRMNPINCNSVHEFDFRSVTERGSTKYIGAGAYRQVYLAEMGTESFVLKKFGEHAAYDMADFEYMRMDTIVAERLSARSEIVDLYAFCGLTNFNEPMMNGNLESVAEPNGLRAPDIHLDDEEHLDPQNDFDPSVKLQYALEMAEAVSLLHSYPGGVIVHDDIQMSQFLFTPEMHLKLNDFNRAEIMTFDEDEGEYCRYTNNPGHGDWRAPEEYHDYPLNEKIDVYSLGNSMYALLTGVGVFYEESDLDEIQRRVKAGEKPYIDPRWRERSFAERKMIEVMELTWTYDPDQRIDIFEVITLLRDALAETKRSYMHEDYANTARTS